MATLVLMLFMRPSQECLQPIGMPYGHGDLLASSPDGRQLLKDRMIFHPAQVASEPKTCPVKLLVHASPQVNFASLLGPDSMQVY